MADTEDTRLKRSRWLFRFSLRSAAILVTGLCGFLGLHLPGVKRQRSAIQHIQRFGGRVFYDFEVRNGAFQPTAKSSVPKLLLSTLGVDHFHRVVRVDVEFRELRDRNDTKFVNGRQTDEALRVIAAFPYLKVLWLDCPQIRNESLKHISFAKPLSRAVIGSMNDLVFAAKLHLAGDMAPSEVGCLLNETPLSMLDYSNPRDALEALSTN